MSVAPEAGIEVGCGKDFAHDSHYSAVVANRAYKRWIDQGGPMATRAAHLPDYCGGTTNPPTEYSIDSSNGSGFVVTVGEIGSVTVGRECAWFREAFPGEIQPALQAAVIAAEAGQTYVPYSSVPAFAQGAQ